MRRALSMLSAVILKEVRQTLRDRRMMALLIAAPAVQLVLFANAVQLDVDRVPTVVVDLDQSHESRTHLTRVLADGTLRKAHELSDPARALRMLETGEAATVVVVPRGFEHDLVRGRSARVQVVPPADPAAWIDAQHRRGKDPLPAPLRAGVGVLPPDRLR